MRLLHPGHDDGCLRAAGEEPGPLRARDSRGHLRESLPLHGLRQHHPLGAARGKDACARKRRSQSWSPPVREDTQMAAPTTQEELGGYGQSVKRKEDPRFLRGKGNYIDDIKLPGMLYMDITRSPFAHAKITDITTQPALDIPGVVAVITGKDLDAAGLGLDADADVGPADGAAGRHRHVPDAGGRGGHRRQPLRRGRRRRGSRGRLRAAGGRGRSLQGAGAGRASAAPRSGDQEQPHLPLGGG